MKATTEHVHHGGFFGPGSFYAVSTATIVKLQSQLAIAHTERDTYRAYANGLFK